LIALSGPFHRVFCCVHRYGLRMEVLRHKVFRPSFLLALELEPVGDHGDELIGGLPLALLTV